MSKTKELRTIQLPLRSARFCDKPSWLKPQIRRGVKAMGLAYENSIAEALPKHIKGNWIEFEDAKGLSWCQIDFAVNVNRTVYVLEAKLTWTAEAHEKLRRLYIPLITNITGLQTYGIVICRAITPETSAYGTTIVRDMEAALSAAKSGLRAPVLLWHPARSPKGALIPQKTPVKSAAKAGPFDTTGQRL